MLSGLKSLKYEKWLQALLMLSLMVVLLIGYGGQTAWAQSFNFDLGGDDTSSSGRLIQLLVLLTVLTLAPSILVMMTSFTRIVMVLSLLRIALGTNQSPPNQVLVSLALFLTLFVMMPTFERIWDEGVSPMVENAIDTQTGIKRSLDPLRDFMSAHVRDKDLALFLDLAQREGEDSKTYKDEDMPFRILIPAYMISEMRRAFEIGFLLFVPFLIIDMVVSSILMAMGMMMLPPVIISLPFKVIFFVLVDGWYLVSASLVNSFSP